jgi:hypothetical protein
MGKKNKKAAVEPVKFIEADPGEVQEEVDEAGEAVPESAMGKKMASAGTALHQPWGIHRARRRFGILSFFRLACSLVLLFLRSPSHKGMATSNVWQCFWDGRESGCARRTD